MQATRLSAPPQMAAAETQPHPILATHPAPAPCPCPRSMRPSPAASPYLATPLPALTCSSPPTSRPSATTTIVPRPRGVCWKALLCGLLLWRGRRPLRLNHAVRLFEQGCACAELVCCCSFVVVLCMYIHDGSLSDTCMYAAATHWHGTAVRNVKFPCSSSTVACYHHRTITLNVIVMIAKAVADSSSM